MKVYIILVAIMTIALLYAPAPLYAQEISCNMPMLVEGDSPIFKVWNLSQRVEAHKCYLKKLGFDSEYRDAIEEINGWDDFFRRSRSAKETSQKFISFMEDHYYRQFPLPVIDAEYYEIHEHGFRQILHGLNGLLVPQYSHLRNIVEGAVIISDTAYREYLGKTMGKEFLDLAMDYFLARAAVEDFERLKNIANQKDRNHADVLKDLFRADLINQKLWDLLPDDKKSEALKLAIEKLQLIFKQNPALFTNSNNGKKHRGANLKKSRDKLDAYGKKALENANKSALDYAKSANKEVNDRAANLSMADDSPKSWRETCIKAADWMAVGAKSAQLVSSILDYHGELTESEKRDWNRAIAYTIGLAQIAGGIALCETDPAKGVSMIISGVSTAFGASIKKEPQNERQWIIEMFRGLGGISKQLKELQESIAILSSQIEKSFQYLDSSRYAENKFLLTHLISLNASVKKGAASEALIKDWNSGLRDVNYVKKFLGEANIEAKRENENWLIGKEWVNFREYVNKSTTVKSSMGVVEKVFLKSYFLDWRDWLKNEGALLRYVNYDYGEEFNLRFQTGSNIENPYDAIYQVFYDFYDNLTLTKKNLSSLTQPQKSLDSMSRLRMNVVWPIDKTVTIPEPFKRHIITQTTTDIADKQALSIMKDYLDPSKVLEIVSGLIFFSKIRIAFDENYEVVSEDQLLKNKLKDDLPVYFQNALYLLNFAIAQQSILAGEGSLHKIYSAIKGVDDSKLQKYALTVLYYNGVLADNFLMYALRQSFIYKNEKQLFDCFAPKSKLSIQKKEELIRQLAGSDLPWNFNYNEDKIIASFRCEVMDPANFRGKREIEFAIEVPSYEDFKSSSMRHTLAMEELLKQRAYVETWITDYLTWDELRRKGKIIYKSGFESKELTADEYDQIALLKILAQNLKGFTYEEK